MQNHFLAFYRIYILSITWNPKTKLSHILHHFFLMPSAHGPILCCKELREKVGFFSGVSQRTRTDFLWQTKHRTYLTIFNRSVIWCTRPDFFIRFCAWQWQVRSHCWIKSLRFCRTEVSAHIPIFCRKQLREKIGAIFYRTKSQRTWTDFHSDILSVCAVHYCQPLFNNFSIEWISQ